MPMHALNAASSAVRRLCRRDGRHTPLYGAEGRAVNDCIDWQARAIAAEALAARLELLVYAERPSVANPSGQTWRTRADILADELQRCRNVLPRRIERIMYEGEG